MDRSGKRPGTGTETKAGLFSVLGPYWGIVIILIIMALAGSAINLLIPKIIARAIDAFSAGSFKAGIVIAEFLAAATGIFVFTFLQGVLQTITAERVAKDLRKSLAEKLSDQTYSFIIRSNPSKLLTNLTSDMDSVKMFVAQAFVTIISSLFVIIGASVLLIMINWKLALAVLVIVPVIATAFIIVFRKVRVIFRKSREVIDALNRIINESILGAALIRVLNSQQPENQKFLEKNMESRDLGLIDSKALFRPGTDNHVRFQYRCRDNPGSRRPFCRSRNTFSRKLCSFQQLSGNAHLPGDDDRIHEQYNCFRNGFIRED